MNKENYKKAIDQIHPSNELKQKTLEKIEKTDKRKIPYVKFITAFAMVLVVCIFTQNYFMSKNIDIDVDISDDEVQIAQAIKEEKNSKLQRFESMQELKDAIVQRTNINIFEKNHIYDLGADIAKGEVLTDGALAMNSMREEVSKEFSATNVQVENVDEADIVKTDGEYIYHLTNNKVLIIKADTLEILHEIKENLNTEKTSTEKMKEEFLMEEIFINEDVLVILGNNIVYEERTTRKELTSEVIDGLEDSIISDVATIDPNQTAKAIIYDISDRANPVLKREVELEGYYSNSRMIGDYVYFISTKGAYYTTFMSDDEILPKFRDTAISDKKITINYSDIVYFGETNNYNYTLVAGFNIKSQEEICLETFLGAGETIYASEENLYITQPQYNLEFSSEKNIIYKFRLYDGQVYLYGQGEVKGNLNNQFSMDEYDGKLRIATTSFNEDGEKTNQLYIFDEDLKEIGKIENLAIDEQIYAVRFIGKIGYVVTFKEIDPLFVIDLSDPTNPQIKGELKIPGYSSYLHPYDETHIIGIGYNTEMNSYGGIVNTNMKMSMFDVSDLENPQEMFSINVGDNYTDSEIIYNHKALFYSASKSLIGFPVTSRDYLAKGNINNFMIYKIDLENGFMEHGRICQEYDYGTINIDRAIYIDNTLYTLAETQMVSYDLNTMEKQKELVYFEEESFEE